MDQHFNTRPPQVPQVSQPHLYNPSAFNSFSSQPTSGYMPPGYQPNTQTPPITYRQNITQYNNRSTISTSPANMQQRRATNLAAGTSSGLPHQAVLPSSSITHQHIPPATTNTVPNSQVVSGTSRIPPASFTSQRIPPQEMPLRIAVDSKYIGAIIGQRGANIREISTESKARCVVDVHHPIRETSGITEKAITITGAPENCSMACMKILEVVRREMTKDGSINQKAEVELKIRALNHLIGRLIGRGGATIKKIMEETRAVIFISNEPSLSRDAYVGGPNYRNHPSNSYPHDMTIQERTVTVKGAEIGIVSSAERKISQKLRQCYGADVSNNLIHSQNVLPFLTPLPNDAHSYFGLGIPVPPYTVRAPNATNFLNSAEKRTIRMWVPNHMVGALIGAKGTHIRSIMRLTGVHVIVGIASDFESSKEKKEKTDDTKSAKEPSEEGKQLEEKKTEEAAEQPEEVSVDNKEQKQSAEGDRDKVTPQQLTEHTNERLVTIIGNEMQQYKTQNWVYQRVAEQGYHFVDEVRLCTEIDVPSVVVGRIIGKGGQNVRELQHLTGAQVKIPDDGGEPNREVTTVRIFGSFTASHAVQMRILQLINDFSLRISNGKTTSKEQRSDNEEGQ